MRTVIQEQHIDDTRCTAHLLLSHNDGAAANVAAAACVHHCCQRAHAGQRKGLHNRQVRLSFPWSAASMLSMAQAGPRLTWRQLTDFQNCQEGGNAFSCDLFKDRHPSTISMTVLVVVEMFNALNALSENNSLFQLPPWSNLWLLAAIAVSMLLHVFIMYTPPVAKIFTVTALSGSEWTAVLWLSFPVILVDEALKFMSRNCSLGRVPMPKLARRLSHSKDLLLPTHALQRQGSHEK